MAGVRFGRGWIAPRFPDAFFPKFEARRPRWAKANFTEDFKRTALYSSDTER